MMCLASELLAGELPDDLLGAMRMSRIKDKCGDNYIAWFPRRLRGYLSRQIPGRWSPLQKGATSIWCKVSIYGRRRAEQVAKRHLKRPANRQSKWPRMEPEPDNYSQTEGGFQSGVRRRMRGKQNPNDEGRTGPQRDQDIPAKVPPGPFFD